MLAGDAYLHWLDQCGFSNPARTLLTDIRCSPPVRRVAGGRGNIHGRYPSRKMRRTIQFESHTELGAIYLMEHDPGVLEYWDQPTRLKLHYRGPSGRRVTNWHPPDFLVLRQEGASFEEWKREDELARLVKEHSDRYQRNPSGGYRSAPGEAAAEALGLLYRVRSSRELSAVFIQNLMFLEDYWVTPLVVDEFHRHLLQERVAAQPGVRLADILEPKGEITADMVYALIASEALYVDLTAFPLGEHQEVRLFADAASAAALPHLSFPSTPSLLHTSLSWGGRVYVLIELNPNHVLLQGEFGEPISLPRAFFHRLIEQGAISQVASTDAEPTRLEVRKILNQAGPEAMKVADTRLIAVQVLLYGNPEDVAITVSARTLRRWKAHYLAAEVQYGYGYLGLLPQTSKRGNRNPKSDPVARKLLEEAIKNEYGDPRQKEKIAVYQGYVQACEQRGVAPLTLRTFYRHLKAAATAEVETQRLGTRAMYTEQPPYLYLEYHTPVHGDRPFAIAHIDHTLLDIELVAQASGRHLGRPWATFLMDAFSRRVLAIYLTFDPPSYRSCMMALRICVKRFGRLPQSLVVDGGREFESQYFDHLLVHYRCQKTVRPPVQPRFGAVIERLFGKAHRDFLNNLLGNTKASKVPRTLTREVDPRRLACWTLGDLYTDLCKWGYEVYDQMDHSALHQTPRAMFVNGLATTGSRRNRAIAYDDLFLKETMPTSRAEKGKIQKGKGIKLFGHYYQNEVFSARELVGQSVPIRYDPFDIGILYAFVQNQWLPCQSQFYAQLSGRSERELEIITAELRRVQQSDEENRGLSAARLAAFLEKAEGHQAWLLQRLKDLESHPILDALSGGPRASAPAKRQTSVKRPMEERSPVNLAEVPIYGEYR
jgi:putative transposase